MREPSTQPRNLIEATFEIVKSLQENAATKEDIDRIEKRLDDYDKLLVRGNGQPSLTMQTALMRQDFDSFKLQCAAKHQDISSGKTAPTWEYIRTFVVQPLIIGLILALVNHFLR